MRLAVRSTAIAISLAVVALAPVAASARPAFDPPRVAINSASTGELTTQGQSPAVQPNPDQQVVVVHHRPVVPIPPVLGKTRAAEQAAIDRLKAQHYTDKLPVNAAFTAAALNRTSHPVNAPQNPDNGFDWGDAAIGAAAGLALTLLVVGGAIMLSRRRSPSGDKAKVATT